MWWPEKSPEIFFNNVSFQVLETSPPLHCVHDWCLARSCDNVIAWCYCKGAVGQGFVLGLSMLLVLELGWKEVLFALSTWEHASVCQDFFWTSGITFGACNLHILFWGISSGTSSLNPCQGEIRQLNKLTYGSTNMMEQLMEEPLFIIQACTKKQQKGTGSNTNNQQWGTQNQH